jgi:predicted permease
MFSVLDAMIRPKIGARDPERLFTLKYFGDPSKKVDFAERERAFRASTVLHAAYTEWFVGRDGLTIERGSRQAPSKQAHVRPNFFTVLGVTPLEGRLSPGVDASAAVASIVISRAVREALFSPDESPIGASVRLGSKPYTVIGVAERYGRMATLDFDAWTFATPDEKLVFKVVRLRDGVTLEQATQGLRQLASRFAMAAGGSPTTSFFQLIPLKSQFHIGQFHYALFGSAIAILIVACTNLANLQLARGLTRSAELAVRSALGASRPQIVRQLVLESGLLAAVALVVALLLTLGANAILRATIPSRVGTFVVEPHGSWAMVGVAAAAAVLAVIAVGLLPAIYVSRVDLNSLLKGRTGTGAHRGNRRIYGLLVIVQIALTLPLACAAVLLSRSALQAADMNYLIHERYGYDPTPLIRARVTLPSSASGEKVSTVETTAAIVSHVVGIAGVVDAAVIVGSYPTNQAIAVDDEDGSFREVEHPMGAYTLVSPGYFRTFDRPIDEGADFSDGVYVEPLMIVDRKSADYLWPRSKPVGRLMRMGSRYADEPMLRVVGITGTRLSAEAEEFLKMMSNSRLGAMFRLVSTRDSITLERYSLGLDVLVRAPGNPQDVVEFVRRNLREVSAMPPVVMLETDYLGIPAQIASTRFIAGLFTAFGLLALGLSALGVYALVAQSVTDRRREVAVRISLGATSRDILHSLLREGNVLVLAGIAIGLYLTSQTIHWLGFFLGQVDVNSAPFFAMMCIALFGSMVAAALVPAIRATRLNPMDVLRSE